MLRVGLPLGVSKERRPDRAALDEDNPRRLLHHRPETSLPPHLRGRCVVSRKIPASKDADIVLDGNGGDNEADALFAEAPKITFRNVGAERRVAHVSRTTVCGVVHVQELLTEDTAIRMVPLEGQLAVDLPPGGYGVLECRVGGEDGGEGLVLMSGSRLVVMHFADEDHLPQFSAFAATCRTATATAALR